MINFDKVLAALRIQNIRQIRLFYSLNIILTLILLLRVKIKIIYNLDRLIIAHRLKTVNCYDKFFL